VTMLGTVGPALEPVIPLLLRGPEGGQLQVDAVVDTGFTDYVCVPPSCVEALDLPHVDVTMAFLADGTRVSVDLYECVVAWCGQERRVVAHCIEGNPLVGMALLERSVLRVEVVSGGTVSITPL